VAADTSFEDDKLDEPIFNDDLLASDGDRKKFGDVFKSIMHVLDDPRLRSYFQHYNDLAAKAKGDSRRFGVWAIGLGTAAILLAGAEIIIDYYDPFVVRHLGHGNANAVLFVLAIGAAVCGIASVFVGRMGILIGKRKRDWLHNRFMGEATRQFHFQSMIVGLPDILASLQGADDATREKAREAFKAKRNQWFSEFRSGFAGHIGPMFQRVVDLSEQDGWWHGSKAIPDMGGDHPELVPLFKAYRMLRLEHQHKYAKYKLQDDHQILFSAFPRQQAAVLRAIATWGIGALFTIHILLLVSIIVVVLLSAKDFSHTFAPWSGLLNGAIILIPVIILATRAFEDGLLPETEVDRFEKYEAGTAAIMREFDASKTQAEKLVAMRRMEQLAFDEMRDFLRANNKAVFVI